MIRKDGSISGWLPHWAVEGFRPRFLAIVVLPRSSAPAKRIANEFDEGSRIEVTLDPLLHQIR